MDHLRLKWQRWVAAWSALFLMAALVGCGGDGETGGGAEAEGKLQVAASIAPYAWLAKQVGGEHVHVITVVPPNGDPHSFSPTDREVSAIMRSRLYLQSGMPFEDNGAWFRAVKGNKKITIVDMREGIRLLDMGGGDHHHHHHHHEGEACPHHSGMDPHIWTSPRPLLRQAKTVADAFKAADPEHADDYSANLAAVVAKLQETDREISLKLVPLGQQKFFVFHPSWGYFADTYNLQQVAIEIGGQSPTDHELTRLIEQAKHSTLKAVFVQPQIDAKAATMVAKAIAGPDARPIVVDPLAPDPLAAALELTEHLVQLHQAAIESGLEPRAEHDDHADEHHHEHDHD